MERGGEAQWRGRLSADSSGRGVIAVGITLTWISKDSGLPETTVSLWGQALEAEVNYVFGSITVPQAERRRDGAGRGRVCPRKSR